MTVLVVGASGATGRLLVQQLLNRGQRVKAIVRSADRLPEAIRTHARLSVIDASVLQLGQAELAQHVQGCTAVASCLGHTMSLQGIYGQPRRLVTEATRRLCAAIRANNSGHPTRFVLMNTAGNSNRDLSEPVSYGEKCLIGLIRLLLPPHADNEQAADYLRVAIGQSDTAIEWVVVRPDTLLDEAQVSEYQTHLSPTRSPIFNAGKTSRINVADFIASLITDDKTWHQWRGRMPVIYNKAEPIE